MGALRKLSGDRISRAAILSGGPIGYRRTGKIRTVSSLLLAERAWRDRIHAVVPSGEHHHLHKVRVVVQAVLEGSRPVAVPAFRHLHQDHVQDPVLVKIVEYGHRGFVAERTQRLPFHLEFSSEILARVARHVLQQIGPLLFASGRLERGQQIWITIHVEVTATKSDRVGVSLPVRAHEAPQHVVAVSQVHPEIVPLVRGVHHDGAVGARLVEAQRQKQIHFAGQLNVQVQRLPEHAFKVLRDSPGELYQFVVSESLLHAQPNFKVFLCRDH